MTVVDRLRERAARFSGNPAVLEGSRVITHAELYDRTDRLSRALAELGLRKGDALLAFMGNEHEAIECELAALQSGLMWITLTSRLTWAEVRGVLASCRPKLIVTNEAGLAKIRAGLVSLPFEPFPRIVSTRRSVSAADGSLREPYGFDALVGAHEPCRPDVAVADSDIARLRYTSGTTGSAKAAILPHRVYQASLDNLLTELHELSELDRALHVAPLTHGSGALVYPILWAGGANILLDGFEVDEVLSTIERLRVTTMFTVPTILSRLVSAANFGQRDLTSVRSLIYGGAPMPATQLVPAVERIGHALMQIYGMTEAPWPITSLKQSEHWPGNPRLHSVGKVTSVSELRIVDDSGTPVGPDEVGEIQVRGRNVMDGYYGDPEATRAVLHAGWLCTGDLGRRDVEGFVYIVGRKKDVIISGGFNVYASELELTLCSYPSVIEAAVVGLPHADWGELVAAFVVPRPGARVEVAELEGFLRSRLSGYKCPRRIEVLDELPKNPSGKIVKPEIVKRYTSRSDD